jgi:hypothetical protein
VASFSRAAVAPLCRYVPNECPLRIAPRDLQADRVYSAKSLQDKAEVSGYRRLWQVAFVDIPSEDHFALPCQ